MAVRHVIRIFLSEELVVQANFSGNSMGRVIPNELSLSPYDCFAIIRSSFPGHRYSEFL